MSVARQSDRAQPLGPCRQTGHIVKRAPPSRRARPRALSTDLHALERARRCSTVSRVTGRLRVAASARQITRGSARNWSTATSSTRPDRNDDSGRRRRERKLPSWLCQRPAFSVIGAVIGQVACPTVSSDPAVRLAERRFQWDVRRTSGAGAALRSAAVAAAGGVPVTSSRSSGGARQRAIRKKAHQ